MSRSPAALRSAKASSPRSSSVATSGATASARCTASRARAWAIWNSRWRSVGRLVPARPSAMRACVNLRRPCHGFATAGVLGLSIRLAGDRTPERLRQRLGELERLAALEHADLLQPGLELRRGSQAERTAHVERVVERGALVVEHD